jgi:DNA adenine methylase
VRERYNKEHNPLDFMFIMRTTTNGMPRYNQKGEFNNSFHITRNGIDPERLRKIINEWSVLLNKNNVCFKCCSYDTIIPQKGDFMYLDPPYAGTKGMYFGGFDNKKLFEYLRKIDCSWAMSYDGISGREDNTFEVPQDLYDEHLYIKSGNSSFKRVIGKSNDSIVYESLYLKK